MEELKIWHQNGRKSAQLCEAEIYQIEWAKANQSFMWSQSTATRRR